MDALVSTEWLAARLEAADLRVVDATWYLPNADRDAKAEHAARHIPGAVFFDIDAIADLANPLPHMVPNAREFAERVGRLGLGDGTRVVIYDANRFSASARAWWMFRLFGHEDVVVLDGGLEKWLAEGRPVTDQPTRPEQRAFTPRENRALLRQLDQIRANLAGRQEQVVDVRSAGRFRATEPEPRAGLRSGHIPGSLNLPYADLVAADGTMRQPDEVRAAVAAAGIDPARPIVTSCGSGVTAATAALALHRIGAGNVAVYDGSWTEWGGREDTPIER